MSDQDKNASSQNAAKEQGLQNAGQNPQIKQTVNVSEKLEEEGKTAYEEGLFNNSDNQEPAPDFDKDK